MYDPKTHFLNLHELITAARINLSRNAWDYVFGATESETSVRRNRQALDSLALRPRVLTDVSRVDPSTEFFGRKARIPVAFAPVGSLETFDEGGGASVAAAAAEFGGISVHSSVAQPGLEKTAEAAPDGFRIFQLYVRGDDDFVDDHARRAIANGYRQFVITVDVQHYSRRERDLANRWVKRWVRNRSGMEHQMSFNWDKVKRFKDKHDIPLGIKGIAHPEDAALACEHGCEIVWVSNHGGRQLDHMEGTIAMLPEMVKAVDGRAKIIIDGGFQRGTDVIKALCLGADLVAMGRLMVCALAAAGKEGVIRAFELLEDELTRDLGLMGINSIRELNPGFVRPAAPVKAPEVFGSFPLLHLNEERY